MLVAPSRLPRPKISTAFAKYLPGAKSPRFPRSTGSTALGKCTTVSFTIYCWLVPRTAQIAFIVFGFVLSDRDTNDFSLVEKIYSKVMILLPYWTFISIFSNLANFTSFTNNYIVSLPPRLFEPALSPKSSLSELN